MCQLHTLALRKWCVVRLYLYLKEFLFATIFVKIYLGIRSAVSELSLLSDDDLIPTNIPAVAAQE